MSHTSGQKAHRFHLLHLPQAFLQGVPLRDIDTHQGQQTAVISDGNPKRSVGLHPDGFSVTSAETEFHYLMQRLYQGRSQKLLEAVTVQGMNQLPDVAVMQCSGVQLQESLVCGIGVMDRAPVVQQADQVGHAVHQAPETGLTAGNHEFEKKEVNHHPQSPHGHQHQFAENRRQIQQGFQEKIHDHNPQG